MTPQVPGVPTITGHHIHLSLAKAPGTIRVDIIPAPNPLGAYASEWFEVTEAQARELAYALLKASNPSSSQEAGR